MPAPSHSRGIAGRPLLLQTASLPPVGSLVYSLWLRARTATSPISPLSY